MPLSRYSLKDVIINDYEIYDELFRNRGIKKVAQYETIPLYYPTTEQLQTIKYETRRWKMGDRLYKIAAEFYGDSRYWWVVAQFNKKPTESHFKVGDIYYIPLSIEQVLEYYRV